MHVHLQRVDMKTLQAVDPHAETSGTIRKRVVQVRATQQNRQGILNGQLASKALDRYCQLDQPMRSFVERACEKLTMSARAYHRVLKLARTIADMEGQAALAKSHIAEALGYRSLDRG